MFLNTSTYEKSSASYRALVNLRYAQLIHGEYTTGVDKSGAQEQQISCTGYYYLKNFYL